MSDVFILGAGFSKAISDQMPLLGELGELVRTRLKQPAPAHGSIYADVELWLTYLAQDHPWNSEATNLRNHAQLLDLSRAIGEVLESRSALAEQGGCPDWLDSLARSWHANQSSVITLNYDTLVEQAVTSIEVGRSKVSYSEIYPISLTPAFQRVAATLGGEARPTMKLFKLHGSINWMYSGSRVAVGETIYYIAYRGWASDADSNQRQRQKNVVLDKIPLIVPPVAEKLPYFQHETVRSLWAQAGQELRCASRVFCLGYSLPPTDITFRYFLEDNAPIGKIPFYVVRRDATAVDKFRALLPEHYDVRGDFTGPNPIQRLADALSTGQL